MNRSNKEDTPLGTLVIFIKEEKEVEVELYNGEILRGVILGLDEHTNITLKVRDAYSRSDDGRGDDDRGRGRGDDGRGDGNSSSDDRNSANDGQNDISSSDQNDEKRKKMKRERKSLRCETSSLHHSTSSLGTFSPHSPPSGSLLLLYGSSIVTISSCE